MKISRTVIMGTHEVIGIKMQDKTLAIRITNDPTNRGKLLIDVVAQDIEVDLKRENETLIDEMMGFKRK